MGQSLAEAEQWLRGPRAWHELRREALGRNTDRQCELQRAITNPPKVKDWADVPSAIREWESLIEEHDLVSNTTMSGPTKRSILQQMLPRSLEEKVVIHPAYDEGYVAFRDHVGAVLTRLGGRRPIVPRTQTGPSPGGHAAKELDHVGAEEVPVPDDEDSEA